MPSASRLFAPLAVVAVLGFAACGSDDESSNDSSSSSSGTTTESSASKGGAYAPPADTSTSSSSSSASSSGGGGQDLKLSADPGGALKFDKTSLDAKAGKVTLTMDNPSSVPHAVAVEGNGVDKDGKTVEQGGVSTVTVSLKKGTYTFYCPVPGHEEAGMKGTLTVK